MSSCCDFLPLLVSVCCLEAMQNPSRTVLCYTRRLICNMAFLSFSHRCACNYVSSFWTGMLLRGSSTCTRNEPYYIKRSSRFLFLFLFFFFISPLLLLHLHYLNNFLSTVYLAKASFPLSANSSHIILTLFLHSHFCMIRRHYVHIP